MSKDIDYNKLDEIINKYKKEKAPVKEDLPKREVTEEIPKEEKQEFSLDTIQEQIESPMTTINCKESIKEKELKKIDKNPENYIEINFIKTIRVVDSFYIRSNIKSFSYKETKYNIVEENIYILPTKKGYFMPTCFYKENTVNPVDFRQKNKGISGKALSLLYDVNLYIDLFTGEEGKYNLFVVILTIVSISCYLIGLYFILGGRFA
jgi:hypothetical protein